jgi:short subunit fatty acids transporter
MKSMTVIPKLIDSNTGYHLYETLKKCHENRVVVYSYIFNAIIVVVFIVITCVVLYACFTRKKSTQEIKQDIIHDQQYILGKIRSLQEQKQNYYEKNSLTQLPVAGIVE